MALREPERLAGPLPPRAGAATITPIAGEPPRCTWDLGGSLQRQSGRPDGFVDRTVWQELAKWLQTDRDDLALAAVRMTADTQLEPRTARYDPPGTCERLFAGDWHCRWCRASPC